MPDPTKIPQVESSIVASVVEIKLLQRQYLSGLQFLSDQFTYGASSKYFLSRFLFSPERILMMIL